MKATVEAWLRGAIPGVPPLLQPVAHSLLQSREEVDAVLPPLSLEQLWTSPGGAASVGYHARHAAGALDRLFTYARREELSSAQRLALLVEASAHHREKDDAERLRAAFAAVVEQAIEQLRHTPDSSLLEPREVGRAKAPSTVIGLLFHGAEHTQRHVGQLTAIAKVVRAGAGVTH